jgi:site-specific DNA-methyltransferase (adenine-specific)
MKEQFGNITLYNADCMDILRELPDKQFDLAIVDPPYFDGPNKLGYYGTSKSSKGVKRPFYKAKHWTVPGNDYFEELMRVSKHQIIWGCNYYQFPFGSGRIVWDKVNGRSSFSDCEIAYCSMIDTVRMFSFMWNGMCQGKSASEGRIQQGNKALNEVRIHPTQKPVVLYKWLLANYAKPGDRILDTHGGSMSSAIAAHDMGFEMTIIEKDPEYYTTARRRLQWHQAQQKLF